MLGAVFFVMFGFGCRFARGCRGDSEDPPCASFCFACRGLLNPPNPLFKGGRLPGAGLLGSCLLWVYLLGLCLSGCCRKSRSTVTVVSSLRDESLLGFAPALLCASPFAKGCRSDSEDPPCASFCFAFWGLLNPPNPLFKGGRLPGAGLLGSCLLWVYLLGLYLSGCCRRLRPTVTVVSSLRDESLLGFSLTWLCSRVALRVPLCKGG